MRIRHDNSIQSAAVPSARNLGRERDWGLYRGVVVRTKYADGDNFTKKSKSRRVLYDLILLGGENEGRILTNVRKAGMFGGNSNYSEDVLTASSKEIGVPLREHDGDVVYIQFLQGDTNYPVITGCDNGLDTEAEIGAEEADGVRLKRKFNGVKQTIDKDGILKIEFDSGISIECYPASNKVVVNAETIELAGNTDALALASKVNSEIDKLKNDITSLKNATSTGLGTIPVVGGTTKSTFDGALLLVPSTASSVASTKVKAV